MAPNHPTSEYTSVLDIPYMKRMIFTLNAIGSWPHKVMGEKKWFSDIKDGKKIFFTTLCGLILFISFLKNNVRILSFLDMGRHYINALMCFITVQRLYMTGTEEYKIMTQSFFGKMHLFYHKDKNAYAMKTYINVEKISSFFCNLLHFEIYVGVVLYNLTPLYNSYRRGMFKEVKPLNATYDHSCFYDLPFDYTTKFNGFLAVHIFNWFFTFDVACAVALLDLYLFIIIFHLWGHIKILKHNLANFPKPEMKNQCNSIHTPPWYNEEESRLITNLLVESMEHYKYIKTFMDEVSVAFGATICLYFLFHQMTQCILLLEISQMTPHFDKCSHVYFSFSHFKLWSLCRQQNAEAFGSYGIFTFVSFQQLIEMSVIFELIGSQSETIKDAVYGVPWECMDTKNRKLVLNYLCNVQNPMQLKAMGLVAVGVRTMASILKTTISYFMLLKASTSTH